MSSPKIIYFLLLFSSICSCFSTPLSVSEEDVKKFLQQRKARLEDFNGTLTSRNHIKFFEILNNAVLHPKSVRNTLNLIASSYPYFKTPSDTIYQESIEFQQEFFQVMRDVYLICWHTRAQFYYNSFPSGFHPLSPKSSNDSLVDFCLLSSPMQGLLYLTSQVLLAPNISSAEESRQIFNSNIGLWRNLTNYVCNCVPMQKVKSYGSDYEDLLSLASFEQQVSDWSDSFAAVDTSEEVSSTLETLSFWSSHPEDFRKSLTQGLQPSEILEDLPFFPTDASIREFNSTAVYKAVTSLLVNESTELLQEGIGLLRDTFVGLITVNRSEPQLKANMEMRYLFDMSEVTLLQVAKIAGMHWNLRYVSDVEFSRYFANLDDNGVMGHFIHNPDLPKNPMIKRIRKSINDCIELYWKVMKSRRIFPRQMEERDRAVVCNFKSVGELTSRDRIPFQGDFEIDNQRPYSYSMREILLSCSRCMAISYKIDVALDNLRRNGNYSFSIDLTYVPLLRRMNDFLKDAPKEYKEQGLTLIKHLYEYSWVLEPQLKSNSIPNIFFMEGSRKHRDVLLRELQIFGQQLNIKYLDKFGEELVLDNGTDGSFKWVGGRQVDQLSMESTAYLNLQYILEALVKLIFEVMEIKKGG
ncbi:uncharacterized protein LOC107037088 [Diachasma alloeum]|uniref:uncharacterized protein LOC107037088 n=1 Tax=Diachasma alloeum TaxID=454923 RepID=UPI0007382ABD|nr:uncharacterized protein LOC107037088 [Diachasma alloeum]